MSVLDEKRPSTPSAKRSIKRSRIAILCTAKKNEKREFFFLSWRCLPSYPIRHGSWNVSSRRTASGTRWRPRSSTADKNSHFSRYWENFCHGSERFSYSSERPYLIPALFFYRFPCFSGSNFRRISRFLSWWLFWLSSYDHGVKLVRNSRKWIPRRRSNSIKSAGDRIDQVCCSAIVVWLLEALLERGRDIFVISYIFLHVFLNSLALP